MGLTRWISDIELQESAFCPSEVSIDRDWTGAWWLLPDAWHASRVTAILDGKGHAGSASRAARYTRAHMASIGTFAAWTTETSRASIASEAFGDEDR